MLSSSHRPPRPPVTARGQRTRQRLLDAAESVFGGIGYERASIVEITRSARVAQGTFYVYFESKKSVFVELVWALNRRLRERLRRAAQSAGRADRVTIARAAAVAFLEFVREHRNLYRIVRQAEFVDEALFRDYYRELSAEYRGVLERSMEAGEIASAHPEALIYMLMGMLDFVGMRWLLWEGRMPPAAAVDDMLAFVHAGLRGQPGGPTTGGVTGDDSVGPGPRP